MTKKKALELKPYTPAHMSTVTNKLVDINFLADKDIDLVDIAHSLGMLCRYNGHTKSFYSVAEHSVRLATYAYNNYPEPFRLELAKLLLIHDATEAYVGDIVYHLKRQMTQFCEVEAIVDKAIHAKFGLTEQQPIYISIVKELDRRICFDEMYLLFEGNIDPMFYDQRIVPLGFSKILLNNDDKIGWSPEDAKKKFLGMAAFLGLLNPKPEEINHDENHSN